MSAGAALLVRLLLRPLGRDRLRTALTVLAIALGVAVVLAIELAGQAAAGSFRASLENLVGKTDLEILANGGVEETWMGALAALPVNARFAPVLEDRAMIPGAGPVTVFGVDLVAASRGGADSATATGADPAAAAVLSQALARRLGRGRGAGVQVIFGDTPERLEITGVIEAGLAEFLLLDIARAQQALERYRKLDRIEVFVSPSEDLAGVERALRRTLPESYTIARPGVRSQENQRMLRAFRWNLRVLSYVSLVVGAFLIYNTIAVSVVRRRGEIGVVRALGASRRMVLGLFLAEALLLGAAGSALGILLGRLLAQASVELIAGTVNQLYTSSPPAPVALTFGAAAAAALAGVLVSLASAWAPAREATAVPPTEAMRPGAREHSARLRWRLSLAGSGLLAALALAASRLPPIGGMPAAGYAAALAAIGAAALAAPALTLAADRAVRWLLGRHPGVELLLAARSLTGSLARTSVIIAALATAIAMMASVAILVGSFRQTVLVWLETQLRADLYVRPAARSAAGEFLPLDREAPARAKTLPGVEAVDIFHALEFRYRGERSTLGAGDLEIVRRYGRLTFLGGPDRDAILRSLPGRDRAIVSEPFANRHGLAAGDRLRLALGERSVDFEVAGVYYDYSSSQGYVILDRSTLLRYLPGQPATNLAVYLAPGADPIRAERRLEQLLAPFGVVVAPNRELRRNAVEVFDRTFAITYALEAVAILVAMLGAASSLLALVLDRRRETALLRYLGAAPGQIRRIVIFEAGALGLLAALLGLALGLALSALLIYVVNKQSFGWTIQFHPPLPLLAAALALVWGATVASSLYPARVAARLSPTDVIRND